MKTGRTLQELGLELQRQRSVRQDYVADSRSLSFITEYQSHNGHLQPCFTGHAAGSGIGYGCIVFQGDGFLSENSADIDMLPLTAL